MNLLKYWKSLLIFFSLVFIVQPIYSQYSSYNGATFSPVGTFRFLNIYVNIVYDQTPNANPLSDTTHFWMPDTTGIINCGVPKNLLGLMDTAVSISYNGFITKYFHESSFGKLIILGDGMMVNILQSEITPKIAGKEFSAYELSNALISLINREGGVNAIYGYNSISDYDSFTPSSEGKPKLLISNNKIDYLQIHVRNSTRIYGQMPIGNGFGNIFPSEKIKIGNSFYGYDDGSIQCVGADLIGLERKNTPIHEFAHSLLGSNAFHEGGGNSYNSGSYIVTFMGLQFGYGLLGGSNSGLLSCNAYDRWRLNWRLPHNNPYEVWASDANGELQNAAMEQSSGNQVFYLRDFVTFGDALRIKLPYKDSDQASNQYLWIENHQVGRNKKIDYLHHANFDKQRYMGTAGIYAYIQVGKDITEGAYNEVFTQNETDNLRFLTADGFWDMCLHDSCQNTYSQPNPFMGAHDLASVYSIPDDVNIINPHKYSKVLWYKLIDGKNGESMPFLGETSDAFTSGTTIRLSTNPAPVNAITYYCRQQSGNVSLQTPERNTRKIHLSGLSLKFTEEGENEAGKIMKVEVDWNNYLINNNVRWTGNIQLRDKLVLNSEAEILLTQNKTPAQHLRDSVTGLFSTISEFHCLNGSELILMPNSTFKVEKGSILNLHESSTLILEENAKLEIMQGSKIQIDKGAQLINQKGNILFENADKQTIKELKKLMKGNGKIKRL